MVALGLEQVRKNTHDTPRNVIERTKFFIVLSHWVYIPNSLFIVRIEFLFPNGF